MSTGLILEVKQLIQNLSATWMENRMDELPLFFDEQVVLVTPDGEELIGREQMVESYKQFVSMSKIHRFDMQKTDVKIFESTAIARYKFQIEYEISGQRHIESGIETLVLLHKGDAWQIIWRTQQHSPVNLELEML